MDVGYGTCAAVTTAALGDTAHAVPTGTKSAATSCHTKKHTCVLRAGHTCLKLKCTGTHACTSAAVFVQQASGAAL